MRYLSLFFLLFFLLGHSACERVVDMPPEITDVVVESHDASSLYVKRGGVLSLSFNALANNKTFLDYYHLEIHNHPVSGLEEDEYKLIDTRFTEQFNGLKNAFVHQHISVSDTAEIGEYHLSILVVDMEGNAMVNNGNEDTKIIVQE